MRRLTPGWLAALMLAVCGISFAVVPPLLDHPSAAKTVVVAASMVDTPDPAATPVREVPLSLGAAKALPVVASRPRPVVKPRKKAPKRTVRRRAVTPVKPAARAPVQPVVPRPTITPRQPVTPTPTVTPKKPTPATPKPTAEPAPTFDSVG